VESKEQKVVHQYKPSKNYIKLPVVRKVSPVKEVTIKQFKSSGIVFPLAKPASLFTERNKAS